MSGQSISILQLYPRDMNLYGDWGNSLVLKRRLEWCGFQPVVSEYHQGEAFPDDVDIIIGGGGQDSGQIKIHDDLHQIADRLRALVEDGMPMLMVCGLYQLFGRSFTTVTGEVLSGIGVFDAETRGVGKRLTGNAVVESERFGAIVGFENHSGMTYLGPGAASLGKVRSGFGNNGEDRTEGALYRNVLGTYLHGPVLPKNPAIADFLIATAIERKYGPVEVRHAEPEINKIYTERARQHILDK